MAMLVEKTGQIRDRSRGYVELSYNVPRNGKSFMNACLEAHKTITSLLPKLVRQNITPKELRQSVLLYVNLTPDDKREMIARLALPYNSGVEALGTHSLTELYEVWKNGRVAEGFLDKAKSNKVNHTQRVILDFFKEHNLRTTNDLKFSTAHDFINWRSNKRYDKNTELTSASKIKKELNILKQLAKLAAMYGWIHNGNLWDSVKVKVVVGKNKKVVEPLSVEEQKNLLDNLLKSNEACHDSALFLLLTGMRLGELASVNSDSVRNNIIALHSNHIGKIKTSGKTISASRNLPVCPTVAKLFERGNIFKITPSVLQNFLKKHFKGFHPHRLRHTFAVNKLLAQTPLQMVSYQMGHSTTGITADLYGKFEPKHFKAGFEEAINERKTLLKWLEEDYF